MIINAVFPRISSYVKEVKTVGAVRFAKERDIPGINDIRKEVSMLHAEGRPDIFKADFGAELENRLSEYISGADKKAVVFEQDGEIRGFAMLTLVERPEGAYTLPRKFIHIEEFGTASKYRHMGIGRAMTDFIAEFGKLNGFPKIELDVWEFNGAAMQFYEDMGYKVYRRFMELEI